MDKIIRRVRTVERQVARRLAKSKKLERAIAKHESIPRIKETTQEVRMDIRKARKARLEDWELGPLAPKRDIANVLDFNPSQGILHWGTLGISRGMEMNAIRKEDLESRCSWAGGSEKLCLAAGDRVVMTEGVHKGKIDRIAFIDMQSGTVRLQDTKINITVPGHFVGFDGMTEAAAVPMRISIGSLRLVHPIRNEETGVTKDMIIREIKPIKVVYDKVTRTMTWSRMVPGLNVTIPWPKVEEPEHDELPCDTPRINVEEVTFVPTLLRPPMPEVIIDELRGKFSRFRTRHTEEYIAAKEAEEAEKRALKDKAKEMLTPVQEFNRLEREKRRARGQPVLSDEMLAKIGEVMAKNRNGKKKPELSIPAEIKKPEEVQQSS